MKSIFTFLLVLTSAVSFSQIEGTWKLSPQAQALGVGPTQGDIGWWANGAGDVTTRACLFDDSVKFDANLTMTQYMDNSSWIETWQGAAAEGCDVPVAPHNGMPTVPYTYVFDAGAGTLTINGSGGHLGLPKAVNAGELSGNPPPPVPNSIDYLVAFSSDQDTMTVDINFTNGFWRYIYVRTVIAVAPPATADVTFSVDMSEYTGTIGTAVNLSGTFNSWCADCAPMTNVGNDVYEVTVNLPLGAIEYVFQVDSWSDEEMLTPGDACVISTGGFNNRAYDVTADATISTVCWASCDACVGLGIEDLDQNRLEVTPNPVSNSFVLHFDGDVQNISITDLSGRIVKNITNYNAGDLIDASDLESGAFIVLFYDTDGMHNALFIKE